MMKSTTIIAFDQHAATTVAAVLSPHQRTPEAVRDLLRCREDIRADLLRAGHRLSKFLLRHGRRFTATKRAWSRRHDAWLRAQTWPLPALDQTHRAYLRAVDEGLARLHAIEQDLRALITLEPLRSRVERLRCFRGIDDLTALTIAAELGDPRRFATAPRTMAFVGLVPSEHSSGEHRRQGSITKVGNSHVRRLLVEAAWHARRRPTIGYELARRQRGQEAIVIERAWRCQQRLHQRWQKMAGRGKPHQKIVVACARELAGFVWAVASEQPLRRT